MIDLNRRDAFTRAFKQYPEVLEHFARNHCHVENIFTHELDLGDTKAKMACLFAQFLTRIIQTRCIKTNNPVPALVTYANQMVERYRSFTIKTIGSFEIRADPKYFAAMQIYEQNMANTIFHALAAEAAMLSPTSEELQAMTPEGRKYIEQWKESGFWTDVMLSFSSHTKPDWPVWTKIAQDLFLDYRASFDKATDAEDEAAPLEPPSDNDNTEHTQH